MVKGWYGLFYYAGTKLGYCDSVSVSINANLDPFYEIGTRTPVDLVVGQEEVTGSLERAWIDNTILALVEPNAFVAGILPSFTLVFYADQPGTAQVALSGCKLENAGVELTPDGITLQSSDFRAKTASLVGG